MMSIGRWIPEGAAPASVDPQMLVRFAELDSSVTPMALERLLDPAQRTVLPGLMHAEASFWQGASSGLSDQQLVSLICIFTLAENLPGCESGEKSPVIPLAKALRQRGQKLDKETLLWMRKVNKNRFLPYGPL